MFELFMYVYSCGARFFAVDNAINFYFMIMIMIILCQLSGHLDGRQCRPSVLTRESSQALLPYRRSILRHCSLLYKLHSLFFI